MHHFTHQQKLLLTSLVTSQLHLGCLPTASPSHQRPAYSVGNRKQCIMVCELSSAEVFSQYILPTLKPAGFLDLQ